jgi:hypothetical protein
VRGFIEDLATCKDFGHEPVAQSKALVDLLGGPNYDVDGKIGTYPAAHRGSLTGRVAGERHDDEEVGVRVLTRRPMGKGTEKQDPVGPELLGYSLGKLLNAVYADRGHHASMGSGP